MPDNIYVYIIGAMVIFGFIGWRYIKEIQVDAKEKMQPYYETQTQMQEIQSCMNDNLAKLNNILEKLSLQIEEMEKWNALRDKRIEKHGKEIDEVSLKVVEIQHQLANHETRVLSIENSIMESKKFTDKLLSLIHI